MPFGSLFAGPSRQSRLHALGDLSIMASVDFLTICSTLPFLWDQTRRDGSGRDDPWVPMILSPVHWWLIINANVLMLRGVNVMADF